MVPPKMRTIHLYRINLANERSPYTSSTVEGMRVSPETWHARAEPRNEEDGGGVYIGADEEVF